MAKKQVKRVATPKRAAATAAAEKNKKAEKAEQKKTELEKKENKPDPKVKDKPETTKEKVDKTTKATEKHDKTNETDQTDNDSINQSATDESANDTVEKSQDDGPDDSTDVTDNQDESARDQNQTNEESIDEKKDRAESPLNILIGEEEENLLLNSGDENVGEEDGNKKPKTDDTETKKDDKNKDDTQEDDANKTEEQNDQTADPNNDSTNINETAESTNTSANDKDQSTIDKENKNSKNTTPGRSLWVTNLLPSTRAQELKHLLSRYGKVIGAKVVQSSRHPRTRCYGYVTMETKAAADLCIEKLNNTELKGQIIRVAKVRPEHSLPLKSSAEISENADKTKTPTKSEDKSIEKKTSPSENSEKKRDKSIDRKSKEHSRSRSRKDRSLSERDVHRKKTEVLTFDKIREERDRHRQRERERAQREQEKRRREIQRAREIERRQRDEAQRLEREREKLRIERERLDRQRQEILRLERERQKLEREKLEQEKRELRRQQLRLEESRRPVKRPASTSTSTYRREATGYPDDRKREAREERHYEEAPPPPRFEVPPREPVREISREKKEIEKDYKPHMPYPKHSEDYSKRGEYKREFPTSERHSSSSHLVHGVNNGGSSKYESSGQFVNRDREIREPYRREPMPTNVGPPPKISSEVRYNERPNERSPVPYRGVRDERERRPMSEHHSKGDIRSARDHRYPDAVSSSKDGGRYREGNSWHTSGPSPTQPFSGIGGPNNSSRDSWSKPDNWRPIESGSNERWVGNSSSRLMMSSSSVAPGPLYSAGNSSTLNCPPPPGSSSYSMDRFDNYKSMGNARKY